MPTRLPATQTTNRAKSRFTSRSSPAGTSRRAVESTKMEAPTQQAEIHIRASCRCQARTMVMGSASARSTPRTWVKRRKSWMVSTPATICSTNSRAAATKNL